MLSLVTDRSGSEFSRSASALPSEANSACDRSITQLYLVQAASSFCLKFVLLSNRATARSIPSLAKNVFIRGGNQAIGAPSGLRALRAPKRVIESFAWRSKLDALATSDLELSIFFWRSAISAKVLARIFCNGPRKKVK